ncbi:MAG: OmpA family protein [Blastocatellia bacterium]
MNTQKISCMVVLLVALVVPALAQDGGATRSARMVKGQKQKIAGVVVKRDGDAFVLRDQNGVDTKVMLSNATKVIERKSNPFRGAKNYGVTQIVRGLEVEVEGLSDGSQLSADKVRFRDNDFRVARSIETRVMPVETRVTDTEGRVTRAEENAQRLSGQIGELNAVTDTLKTSTKQAQATADSAMAGVQETRQQVAQVNTQVNNRISMIDDYEPRKVTTVNFKVNSSILSPEARLALDEIAGVAKTEKAFLIEVAGFASAEGSVDKNRVLSQRRADSVVRYLAETHMIPLRRITTPFGYGASNPIADNTARDGRQQNRRVEVRVLVSKGLTMMGRPGTGE